MRRAQRRLLEPLARIQQIGSPRLRCEGSQRTYLHCCAYFLLDRQERPDGSFFKRHPEGTLNRSASATPGFDTGRRVALAVPVAPHHPPPCRRHRWGPCPNSHPRRLRSAGSRTAPGCSELGVHSLQSLCLARRSRSVGPRASKVVKLVAVQQRGQAAALRRVTPRAGHASRHGSGAAYRER